LAATLSEGLGAINYQGEIIEIAVNRLLLFVIHDKPADAEYRIERPLLSGASGSRSPTHRDWSPRRGEQTFPFPLMSITGHKNRLMNPSSDFFEFTLDERREITAH